MGLLWALPVLRPTSQKVFLSIIFGFYAFEMVSILTQNIMLILQFLGYQPPRASIDSLLCNIRICSCAQMLLPNFFLPV